MAILKFSNVGITSIAASVPHKKFYNRDLINLMPEDTLNKLIGSIGIEEKRFAEDDVCASDLCIKAARQLMDENDIEPSSIDMLLFLSLSHDYITPPTSVVMQHKLGLPDTVGCIDMSLACSGFIYALSTAFSYASNSGINKVLLCVGETMSKLMNARDKVNFPLYGDAGTACIVEKGDFGESTFILSSDGTGEQSVIIPSRGFRNKLTAESLLDKEREEGNFRRDIDITMDGMDTFNHAISVIPKQVKNIMKVTNITADDIDYFVSHQANKFMIDFIVKRLKFDPTKVPFCIKKYGNTSCASVPLTIVSELEGKLDGRKRLLMSSIGAGWSFSTVYLTTNNLQISHITEY
jgi:3-oxoacyl-[acyl-carrier-protein] synthase III